MHILWDFDGTLFNTYPFYTRLMKPFVPQYSEEEIFAHLKVSFGHAFHYFDLSDGDIARFTGLAGSIPAEEFRPFEGLEQILSSAGVNVIMTHNKRHFIMQILKARHLEKYFTDIVASEDGFPRKPDPASYVYLDRKYGIDLVIGDRLIDIIPGRKIGSKTCLFQNKEHGADFYLNDYRDFFRVVRIE